MAASEQTSAIHRFCRLPTPSYEKIYADANNILDDIISQCHTYRRPNQDISLDEMVKFLSHGCGTLQNASILLKSKFAQVINIYLPLMKTTIDESCVNQLVTFLCQSLTSVKSSLVSDFMKALALTLTGTGALLNEDSTVQLLGESGVVWMYLAQKDWILRSYSIQCLGNICLRSQRVGVMAKENIQLCYSKLLDTLRMLVFEETNEIEHFKLINITLKAIQKVLSGVTMHDNIVEPEFAVLLLKIFLIYGLPGYQSIVNRLKLGLPSRRSDDLETIEKIYPTKKKEKSTMTKKVNAKKGRKKKKKNLNNSIQEAYESVAEADSFSSGYAFVSNWRQMQSASSSESEFSDNEVNQTEQLNSIMSKIRINCAITLQEILRCCDRRSRFACWLAVVPDVLSPEEPSLLYSFLKEITPKMQGTLLLAIMELVDGSRGFLDSVITQQNISSAATKVDRPFTPYSVRIAQSLYLLHDELISYVEKCNSSSIKEKVLKCLTLLMLNTPYKKLKKEYLSSILKLVVTSINSQETTLCQSVITCIAACISIQPNNTHVYQIISATQPPSLSQNNQVFLPNGQTSATSDTSWLVEHCLDCLLLATKENPVELRLSAEYIQLMTVILRCHSQLLVQEHLEKVINYSTNVFMFSTDVSISFHAIKLLEELSKYYNVIHQQTQDNEQGVKFWKKMICGAIPQYLHSEPAKAVKGQAAICDWISNMGFAFDKIKIPEQIFVKTVIIGMTESEEPLISAAAVRALGIIIDYDSMKEDVWFVVDATRSIIKQLTSQSLSVRLKAAWSLANLCDFIAKHGFLENEYPESMILNLLEDSTKAAVGNEKVCPNGVRAIGNLLKAFKVRLFKNSKFENGIKEAINAIVKNIKSGQMKTRWNACYACRYIFENPDFPIGDAVWTDELFTALLEALADCKNFKVRISAAVALTSLRIRSKYGNADMFVKVWVETLKALEKSEELTDFTEFKHKENLQEQTTVLLLHLLSMATPDDIQKMKEVTKAHQDSLIVNCRKCAQRVELLSQRDQPPPSHANLDAYIGYTAKAELNEEEVQKIGLLNQYMDKAKDNICAIGNVDKKMSLVDVLQIVLSLDR